MIKSVIEKKLIANVHFLYVDLFYFTMTVDDNKSSRIVAKQIGKQKA